MSTQPDCQCGHGPKAHTDVKDDRLVLGACKKCSCSDWSPKWLTERKGRA